MPTTDQKTEIIKTHGKTAKDVGSTAVQVALLTARITELTEHLKTNKKDLHSARGLQLMVGRRRGLLDYLAKTDEPGYQDLIKKLKLRK